MKNLGVSVSAPARLDFSDVDLPMHFFRMRSGFAHTVNFAIERRIKITYRPRRGRSHASRFEISSIVRDIHGDLRSVNAIYIRHILEHFDSPKGRYDVVSDIPFRSGLGASSALVACLIYLLHYLKDGGRQTEISSALDNIAAQAVNIENSIGRSSAGYQDALAACWGGGNQWVWGIASAKSPHPWRRRMVLSPKHDAQLTSRHFLMAFTGESHKSNIVQEPTRYFSNSAWRLISSLGERFADAVRNRDWSASVQLASREWTLRRRLAVLSPRQEQLIRLARASGASARFSGTGPGGCVWAIGDRESITATRGEWESATHSWRRAFVESPVLSQGIELESFHD